jgi:F1F0 ATPase subunit 2
MMKLETTTEKNRRGWKNRNGIIDMNWLYHAFSFLAGALLGVFFFGGLWWTVQKITGSGRPYLLSVISFLVRTAVVLAGFYLILTTGWPHLLAALLGFLAARTVLAYKIR